MRLTVPGPKIELYEDGFANHDQLNRKETGDELSDLAERIDDPLVIALDGAWGSGKSFFLKCWVGEHLQRQGNTTQTIYFDAFQHDFPDDPLIALTGAIARRFEEKPSDGGQERANGCSNSQGAHETEEIRPVPWESLRKSGDLDRGELRQENNW